MNKNLFNKKINILYIIGIVLTTISFIALFFDIIVLFLNFYISKKTTESGLVAITAISIYFNILVFITTPMFTLLALAFAIYGLIISIKAKNKNYYWFIISISLTILTVFFGALFILLATIFIKKQLKKQKTI
ncbi:Uncharacterised protein [Mycoplasmopsis maculosa]|uniref:DUF4064 domain-containing protein n=1 Tax=Mycoplasmopsis maculosa TaxID=114885 RepID=A0A449B4J1_9BACT|nr:hypothetical protein [Mycoplasmopsis maculosa]VEU75523.1 Uncharacterised protein [Mycoplasmopsis maculosa]